MFNNLIKYFNVWKLWNNEVIKEQDKENSWEN